MSGIAKTPMRRRPPRTWRVLVRSARDTHGWLALGGIGGPRWRCAIGRGGLSAFKREGDGASPVGTWRMVAVRHRGDRHLPPRTGLPGRAHRPHDGWCDAVGDRNYNRPVQHPYPASAEVMWRADHLYDVVVLIAHNWRPRVQGGGSAIFMHLARPGYTPTAGCVALARRDLETVLAHVRPGDRIRIGGGNGRQAAPPRRRSGGR